MSTYLKLLQNIPLRVYTIKNINRVGHHRKLNFYVTFVSLKNYQIIKIITMKKLILTVGCCVGFLSGCCNLSNQPAGERTCNCAAKKDLLEIIMNIPIKIKPEFVSAYKVAFEKCQAASLQEATCLDYSLFQSYTDSTEFHLFERWKNKPGHNAHMETPHFFQYRDETKGMNDKARTKMIVTYVCPCVNQ